MLLHGSLMMAMAGPGMATSGVPWPHAVLSFVAMWTAMMLVMMFPSVSPALWRYHRALATMRASRPALRTLLFGVGYSVAWAAMGVMAFGFEAGFNAANTRSTALAGGAPLAAGAAIVGWGALQLTRWKAHHLAHCREEFQAGTTVSTSTLIALRDGARLGVHCTLSCAGSTAVLLVVGVMDMRAMAVLAAAVTAERIGPVGTLVARATGAIAIGAGVLLLVRASGGA